MCVEEVHPYTKMEPKLRSQKKTKRKNMHSLDLWNINSMLHICTRVLNAEHFHLQLILRASICLCLCYTYANSPVELSTEEQIDMQFHWRKIARIKFQLHWHMMQHALVSCIQVRTRQRLFRQMIVRSDAINQRRKIKSPTFELERVSSNRLSLFGWHTEVLCCRLCEKYKEKLLANLVHTFHCAAAMHYITQFETSDFEKFSIVGWITRPFSCLLFCWACVCFLSNYGNTNWIFISEFHVFHWNMLLVDVLVFIRFQSHAKHTSRVTMCTREKFNALMH